MSGIRVWLVSALVVLGGLAVGCADSSVSRAVGARCDYDRECDGRCLTGGDYPGGLCSIACRDDDDCPSSSRCAPQRAGGICLLACDDDAQCRDLMGSTWECKSQVGASGMVCLGD